MKTLIYNNGLGLKLWRVVGVVLMLSQSGCDVNDNREGKRRTRARSECVAHQFISASEDIKCDTLTKRGAVRFRPWRRTPRPDEPHNSCGRLPDVIWWFLFLDLLVHLVTYRRRNGERESLAAEYLHSWWFVIDALFLAPALLNRFVSTVSPIIKRLTGLDHLNQFLWKNLVRNGVVRDKVVRTARWALRHRRHIRFVLREALLAMDAVHYLERIVEIAQQTYEVVRRRTLNRTESLAVKHRIRAKLRVAAIMKKLACPWRRPPCRRCRRPTPHAPRRRQGGPLRAPRRSRTSLKSLGAQDDRPQINYRPRAYMKAAGIDGVTEDDCSRLFSGYAPEAGAANFEKEYGRALVACPGPAAGHGERQPARPR